MSPVIQSMTGIRIQEWEHLQATTLFSRQGLLYCLLYQPLNSQHSSSSFTENCHKDLQLQEVSLVRYWFPQVCGTCHTCYCDGNYRLPAIQSSWRNNFPSLKPTNRLHAPTGLPNHPVRPSWSAWRQTLHVHQAILHKHKVIFTLFSFHSIKITNLVRGSWVTVPCWCHPPLSHGGPSSNFAFGNFKMYDQFLHGREVLAHVLNTIITLLSFEELKCFDM